jgi:hypothetical protein
VSGGGGERRCCCGSYAYHESFKYGDGVSRKRERDVDGEVVSKSAGMNDFCWGVCGQGNFLFGSPGPPELEKAQGPTRLPTHKSIARMSTRPLDHVTVSRAIGLGVPLGAEAQAAAAAAAGWRGAVVAPLRIRSPPRESTRTLGYGAKRSSALPGRVGELRLPRAGKDGESAAHDGAGGGGLGGGRGGDGRVEARERP